jgi:hypothetical protein
MKTTGDMEIAEICLTLILMGTRVTGTQMKEAVTTDLIEIKAIIRAGIAAIILVAKAIAEILRAAVITAMIIMAGRKETIEMKAR